MQFNLLSIGEGNPTFSLLYDYSRREFQPVNEHSKEEL
jgi:hypothetical protein